MHIAEESDLVALAIKLGTGSSTPSAGSILRANGTGTSVWGAADLKHDVTGILPQANGGTGTTSATGTGKAVYDSSPAIITPTISDFTNATHNHTNAANGGSTLSSPTIITPTIVQINSGASHMVLNVTGSKLVKTTILRQDDTVNTYQAGNTVMLTGWGVGVPGANPFFSETVSFGVSFLQPPIVSMIFGGDNTSGTLTYGAGSPARKAAVAMASTVTSTNFLARLDTKDAGNWTAGDSVFYQWTAIGEIA